MKKPTLSSNQLHITISKTDIIRIDVEPKEYDNIDVLGLLETAKLIIYNEMNKVNETEQTKIKP